MLINNPQFQMQSPIHIQKKHSRARLSSPEITFTQHYQAFYLADKQTTLQVEGTGELLFKNKRYTFIQAHFHRPGEHMIDHQTYPFEMHFVHQSSNGEQLVVAVLFEIGEPNQTLNHFFLAFNPKKTVHFNSGVPLDSFFPEINSIYHYQGSLTTPPFSEGVTWIVISNPLTISQEQLSHYHHLFRANNRACQDINARQIEYLKNKH